MRKNLKYLLAFLSIIFFSCTITLDQPDDEVTEVFKIEYQLNGGVWKDGFTATTEYTKEVEVILPGADNILKTGYSFGGWYEESDFSGSVIEKISKGSTGKKTFYAKWIESDGTKYTVKHFLQNVSGEDYTEAADDAQLLTGKTGDTTAATAKSYTGFTAKAFEQGTIAADGSTIISIYYDRNTITYTFNADGGNWNGSTENKTISGLFEAEVPALENPVKEGFFFTGWNTAIPESFGVEDITFTASWSISIPETSGYKVEHWKQNVNGTDYTIAESDTQSLTGKTFGATNAEANSYVGFTAKAFEQGTIAVDGSTVVKIYYDRNTITYTFNANGGNWSGSTANQTVSGLFGASVTAPAAPVLTGYTFSGWNAAIPSEFGASDITFTASWTANTNTVYKVEHWQQNVSGNGYTKVEGDTQSLTGTTEGTTNAAAKSYDGFTAKTITQATIEADGSTVVKVYYDRKTITYTFKANGGNWNGSTTDKTVSGLFGAEVTSPALPARAGYTAGWDAVIPATFGSTNLTFTATWAAGTNTNYTVQHLQQNINDDKYTLISADTQTLNGTTGAQTNAQAKTYTGFTAKAVTQSPIAADGSTVVQIKYDRNIITYTFNSGDGSWSDGTTSQTRSGKFGATTSAPESPSRTGYNFTGWGTIPETFGNENLSFTASWTAGSGISYKVEHYQQNVENNEYTIISSQTEYKTGTTGSATEASAKEFTGFTAKAFEQGTIAADGSTVIRIDYDRITTTYTFNSGDGSWNGGTTSQTVSGRFGAAVNKPADPVRTGWTFSGWLVASTSTSATIPATFGTNSVEYNASWTANTNTQYTVQHWQQKTSGNEYEIVTDDIETLYGTTGAQTNAQTKSYTGFTAKGVTQTTIAADGSTVIRIDYDRVTTTYTFNSGDGNWNGGTTSQTVSGRYGAAVNKPADPVRTGWTFSGWLVASTSTSATIPATFGTDSVEYNASWTANTNTAYTVKHYQQNIDDNEYTLVTADTESKQGTTGELTSATAKNYTGFTAKAFEQGTIDADGSTVIRIEYDRDTITYSFNANGGNWQNGTESQTSQSVSGKFGAAFTKPANPGRVGYTFNNWNATIPDTFGSSNQTFTAGWTANPDTAYTVQHWQQNIDNDEYTLVSTDTTPTGTTATLTAATANTYTGFTAKAFTQQTIAPDGSTVVRIDYDRNVISYTFNANGANETGGCWTSTQSATKTLSGKFGASLTEPEDPTRIGYTFNGWNASIPQTFGTETLSFTASWTPNTNTAYTVEHWKQNIENDEYTRADSDTQNRTGTTATQTEAAANSYVGFAAQTITQETIAPDGSTVVKVYYNRNTINYTFNANGENETGGCWDSGTPSQSTTKTVSGRFGATVTAPSAPVRSGYYYNGWNQSVPDTFGNSDMTFTAQWSAAGGFEVTVISSDINVTVSASTISPTFTAEECDSYFWYIDDESAGTERTCTVDKTALTKGVHTISLEAQKDGKWYSYYAQITVGTYFTSNASNIVNTITGMTESGIIKVTGALSTSNIRNINSALKTLKSSHSDVLVALDLSQVTGLTSLEDASNSNSTNSFHNCNNLNEIILPDSLKTIGNAAFAQCTGLTSITIPENVTQIGNGAFYNCKNLTSITIPNSVTEIGESAFGCCSSLKKITIPDNVTQIGQSAFYNCKNLTEITISDSVTEIGDCVFYDCTGLIEISIPEHVTQIKYGAFSGCKSLTSITIPNSVTYIDEHAFFDCSNLVSITIPSSITQIGDLAFEECNNLHEVRYEGTLEQWINRGWYSCIFIDDLYINGEKLAAKITIPADITSIGDYAFDRCTGFTEIIIPSSVTQIGTASFSGCMGLESITIPDSVTSIGYSAFSNCTNLTSVTFENPSNWYYTSNSSHWNNYTNGTAINFSDTDTSQNATYLTSTYWDKYFYQKNQ